MARVKKVRTEEEEIERFGMIWIIGLVSFIILITVGGIVFGISQNNEELPPYEEQIITYEVVSVYKYVRNETNGMGGIVDTDICYNFSYISGDELCHVEEFIHYDEGLTKVTIGDSDCYIVNKYTDEKYLQLTKETLNLLSGTSK